MIVNHSTQRRGRTSEGNFNATGKRDPRLTKDQRQDWIAASSVLHIVKRDRLRPSTHIKVLALCLASLSKHDDQPPEQFQSS